MYPCPLKSVVSPNKVIVCCLWYSPSFAFHHSNTHCGRSSFAFGVKNQGIDRCHVRLSVRINVGLEESIFEALISLVFVCSG